MYFVRTEMARWLKHKTLGINLLEEGSPQKFVAIFCYYCLLEYVKIFNLKIEIVLFVNLYKIIKISDRLKLKKIDLKCIS